MKLVPVHNLEPGLIVGKDVYANQNLLLCPAGATLTPKNISMFILHSIPSIYVKDSPVPQKDTPTQNPSLSKEQQVKRFSKVFKQTTATLENQINDVVTKNVPFSPAELLSETSALFTADMTTISLFDMLHHMRNYDDSTYVHSINVALICNVFGRWLNLTHKEIEVLTLCGMLHDIGKISIPDSIVKKPGKLTKEEYAVIKRHPINGYDILKSHTELDPRIAQAALMHHERCDGTGYPTGCSGNKIPTAALILAIADVYDAMTSKRVYRDALSPFQVIRIMENEGVQKYDPRFFFIFLEQIINSYINTDVFLTDGRKAHVIFINKDQLSRPIVTIGDQVIDLSKQSLLDIESMA